MSMAEPRTHQPQHEAVGLGEEDLRRIYYFMQLTRSVEDRVRRLYLQGRLQVPCTPVGDKKALQ